MKNLIDEKEVYVPKPAILALAINANITVLQWGRRTSKTEAFLALRSLNLVSKMPGSFGAMVSPTYKKIEEDLLPGLKRGWERFGYIENVDYVVGKSRIPEQQNWDNCLAMLNDYTHVVRFKNGSSIKFLSQDTKVTNVGISLDWLIIDEAKKIKYDKLKAEIIPALSGNFVKFGHLAEHRSITIASDAHMGDKDSNWFMKYKTLVNPELISVILKSVDRIQSLKESNDQSKKALIEMMEQKLSILQKNAVYYSEASSFDNFHALGFDYFNAQYKNLGSSEFLSAIGNMPNTKTSNCFYDLLTIEKNTYSSYCEKYLVYNDSRADDDIILNAPLDLSIDWGGKWNFCTVSQFYNMDVNIQKNLYVINPRKYQDMIYDFIKYYRNHPRKEVNLFNDPQGNKQVPNSTLTYSQDVIRILVSNGWKVNHLSANMHYVLHHEKHRIFSKVLRGNAGFGLKINMYNANETYVSMANSKLITKKVKGITKFQKNKDSETNSYVLPEFAPHLSDCVDNVVSYYFYQICDESSLNSPLPGFSISS